ncbi:MAG: hypothetical protein K2O99_03485 [Lachnospiraceae bacterium]|nr:hypothetical protein [Lachnospiraceae bacterium]
MKNSTVYVKQWLYREPDLIPDKDGTVVLISKACFGPVEVYQWGINADGQAYALYEWLENDFYACDNYCITIEREALLKQIQQVIAEFRNSDLPDWAQLYETILQQLKENTESIFYKKTGGK